MDAKEILEHARDALTVRRVFGDPIEREGVLVVPVARLMGGAGSGSGEGGGGGGWGGAAAPAGGAELRSNWPSGRRVAQVVPASCAPASQRSVRTVVEPGR